MSSSNLTVEFNQTINSGSGADGQTLAFADASKATPASLGEQGGGLGFSGIPGVAVAFDTYQNAVNPSNNFVGITNGTGAAPDQLNWLYTTSSIPNLRSATRHIKVEVLGEAITVWIEGTRALSGTVALPPQVYLGFTGGTGGLTDVHEVSNVVVSSNAAPVPASLSISSAVVAPSGSSQAATKLAVSGSCPSSFTTAALGNGESATPSLTGAVMGSSCSVSEAAPTGSGWKTTAQINGGPEVALTATAGQLTIPSFALVAGTNTIKLTNTYTEPAGSTIPDPTAGGWELNGTAALTATELVLTSATEHEAGSAFWPTAINPANMTIEYEASITGGTGADGVALVLGDATRGAIPTSLGVEGGGLGFSGIPGIAIALDEYQNAVNPSNNFVGISNGPTTTRPDLLNWLATSNLALPIQNATTRVKVVTTTSNITIYINGNQLISKP